MHPLLADLTPAQREAVQHIEGPLLILAGPGSGKTRVVTHRIAWLLEHGIPGQNILALTFTNKAAEEMRSRVDRLMPGHGVWLSTFHRFCARLLRHHALLVGIQENYAIYDAEDSLSALRRAARQAGLPSGLASLDAIAHEIGRAKNNLVAPDDYRPVCGDLLQEATAAVYAEYQSLLLASNAADFDDLLLHVATLLRDCPEVRQSLDQRYRFILVDEYQDTNFAQYVIARALSIDHQNLAVTGDPDQSIYGWRGANLKNILEFEHDYPHVRIIRLEQNYRSTQHILRAAAELISHNVRRKHKGLFSENGLGRPVRLTMFATERDEAAAIAGEIAAAVASGRRRARDFAVFYRVNALSRAVELALREAGVPYQLVHGLAFFQRKEIKDLLAYLQLLVNPQNQIAFLRAIGAPARGIGKTTVERLAAHATDAGASFVEAARQVGQIRGIGKRAAKPLAAFAAMFDRLSAAVTGSVEEIIGLVLAESGYRETLRQSRDEADQERLANLEELLSVARLFDERRAALGGLQNFLEEVCLINDTDDWEPSADRVTLMTLHASKGLEFPVVYLIAVEEGLLPHERSRQDEAELEEERRLMFVGMTRAQEELQVSLAQCRDYRGQRKGVIPSHFLMELPRDEMELSLPGMASQPPLMGDVAPPDIEPVLAARPASAPSAGPFSLKLSTAAELANGGQLGPPVAPDAFCQGMVVRHPEFGLGKIVALSGTDAQRAATIDFASAAGRRRLVLLDSPLRPVR